jgi:hypothetical protein
MVRECLLAVDAAGRPSRELLPASVIEFPPFSYRHSGGFYCPIPDRVYLPGKPVRYEKRWIDFC